MKVICHVASWVAAVALLVTFVPVRAFASETDARIVESAKQSYVFQTYLVNDAIKIESKDGLVSLTGTVAEETNKTLAQETVASLPGVKSVDNRLEIKGERVVENSDAWVGMKVKSTLLFHRNLSARKTDVQVKDGVVTLSGEAASPAQKDLTTEYVRDVEGVKGIQNEMTVANNPANLDKKTVGESIDDASVTALVKMTLMCHRSTSALHTKVETNKNVVTLSGKAKNAAEKALVSKFAQDVHGVKSVVNNMTI